MGAEPCSSPATCSLRSPKASIAVLILPHGRIVADASLNELARPDQTLEHAYLELTSEAIA